MERGALRCLVCALAISAAAAAAPPVCAQGMSKVVEDLVEGRRLAEAGSYDKALAVAERIIAEDYANPAGHHLRGLALYGLGRTDEACSSYSKSLDLSAGTEIMAQAAKSGMSMCRHAQAYDAWTKGEYAKALELIEIAVLDDSRNTAALLFRGRMYEMMGSPDRALEEYRAVLDANPSESQAFYYIAKTHLGKQDFGSALASFEKFLLSDGGDAGQRAEAHYFAGEAKRDAYDFAGAASHFRKALELKPGMEPAAKSLGLVEERIAAIRAAAAAEKRLAALGIGLLLAACAGLAVAAWKIGPPAGA